MRYLIAAAALTACAPTLPDDGAAEGVLMGEPLTACARTVELGAAPVDDISTLEMESASHALTVSWRGEVDRWYPVTISGTVDGEACTLTVDVGGAWMVSGFCGGVEVYAEATRCER